MSPPIANSVRLDTQGFRDGENTGPYQEELFQDEAAADIAWELDMCARLGVFLA